MKQATFKVSNFNKRTPKQLKRIGDACIYGMPLFIGAITGSPMTDSAKVWTIFGLNVILVGVKVFTKFFTDEQ